MFIIISPTIFFQFIESLLDVTPDVAVVAHQLLSAPLPTIPSYVVNDQSETDNTEEDHFTRAYLLASSSAPIISPNGKFLYNKLNIIP